MNENLKYWNQLKDVPATAQKKIKGGRLQGMTDIKPQWRYMVMTETFGPIGVGWKYTVDDKRIDDGGLGVQIVTVSISLYYKHGGEWSDAIPGVGSSEFTAKEKNGLYTSDDAFKMATTDALSVALKMIGVGATIYMGGADLTKNTPKKELPPEPTITDSQSANLDALADEVKVNKAAFFKWLGINNWSELYASNYEKAVKELEAQRNN